MSSFTDSLMVSDEAQDFLRKSLTRSILSKEIARLEKDVKKSVLKSPCNGPDPEAWRAMERVDDATVKASFDNVIEWKLLTESMDAPVLRFLYIPTALYAVNPESSRSAGRQRQTARADGKKRRGQVAQLVSSLFDERIPLHVCTLDLDDGSVKQPEGSEASEDFPEVRDDSTAP
jgi:hypothetical protein